MRKYGADPGKSDATVLAKEEAKKKIKEAQLARLAYDKEEDEEEGKLASESPSKE
jgi:hypothetical protein